MNIINKDWLQQYAMKHSMEGHHCFFIYMSSSIDYILHSIELVRYQSALKSFML